ncbi:MAG: hypothetical protein Q4A60_09355 [Pasteurellaceae bacterium]|nr:hypothetical protein [Pasteurellaceae bacterium]
MVNGKKTLFCLGLMLMGFSSNSLGKESKWPWSDRQLSLIIYFSDTAKKAYQKLSTELDQKDCKRYLKNNGVVDNFNDYLLSNSYADFSYLDNNNIEKFFNDNFYFFDSVAIFYVCLNKADKNDLRISSRNFQNLKIKARDSFELTYKFIEKLRREYPKNEEDITSLKMEERYHLAKIVYHYRDFAEFYLEIFGK